MHQHQYHNDTEDTEDTEEDDDNDDADCWWCIQRTWNSVSVAGIMRRSRDRESGKFAKDCLQSSSAGGQDGNWEISKVLKKNIKTCHLTRCKHFGQLILTQPVNVQNWGVYQAYPLIHQPARWLSDQCQLVMAEGGRRREERERLVHLSLSKNYLHRAFPIIKRRGKGKKKSIFGRWFLNTHLC